MFLRLNASLKICLSLGFFVIGVLHGEDLIAATNPMNVTGPAESSSAVQPVFPVGSGPCSKIAAEVGKKIFSAQNSTFSISGSYPFPALDGFCINVIEGHPTAKTDTSPAMRVVVVSNGKYMLPTLLEMSPNQGNPPENLVMTKLNGLYLGPIVPETLGAIEIKSSEVLAESEKGKHGAAIIMGGLLSNRTSDWLKKLENHKGSIWYVPLFNPANYREAQMVQTMYALIEYGVPPSSVVRALSSMPIITKDSKGLEEQARLLIGDNNWSSFKVLLDRWTKQKLENILKSRKLILAGVPFPEFLIKNNRLVFDFVL